MEMETTISGLALRDIAPLMENQMEKKMKHEMETGAGRIWGFKELKWGLGFRAWDFGLGGLGSRVWVLGFGV